MYVYTWKSARRQAKNSLKERNVWFGKPVQDPNYQTFIHAGLMVWSVWTDLVRIKRSRFVNRFKIVANQPQLYFLFDVIYRRLGAKGSYLPL